MTAKIRSVSVLLILCFLMGCASACTGTTPGAQPAGTTEPTLGEFVDYVSDFTLNMVSNSAKQEVTVKTYIDGDTVHFHVPTSVQESGVLKGRFLAINTPESTGKIEEYGKAAATFTREKLSTATSILIESDTDTWNPDSTGGRYLVWVWYKPPGSDAYRNLNLEILQNGLAVANSTAQNRYGSVCTDALNQAKAHKLNLYSGKRDPGFYYGEAVELTLKELRCNIAEYNGIKVAFNGIVTLNSGNSVFVEALDPETGLYYGMSVYYGYGLPGKGLDILTVGNEVRIVGTVQYYEVGGTYQVSGLTYRQMEPKDPGNIQQLSSGHSAAYVLTEADTFANGTVQIETEEQLLTFPYAELAMSTSVAMENLLVESIYTTVDEESSSFGAMTLSCTQNGVPVSIRTAVLYDANNALITEDAYLGKTISVKGIVDFYDGSYQIKVFSANDITVQN